jgi:hypothetical protein
MFNKKIDMLKINTGLQLHKGRKELDEENQQGQEERLRLHDLEANKAKRTAAPNRSEAKSQNVYGTRQEECPVCGGLGRDLQFRADQYYRDDYGMLRCMGCEGIISPTQIEGYTPLARESPRSKTEKHTPLAKETPAGKKRGSWLGRLSGKE